MEGNVKDIVRIHKEWGEISLVTVTYADGKQRKQTAFQSWVDRLIAASGKKFIQVDETDQSKTWIAADEE